MSALASFVGKIFLNGDYVTESSLIKHERGRKSTGPKPKWTERETKRKNVTESLQTLRAKMNRQIQTHKGRRRRGTSPDDGGDDAHKPKRTNWKNVADSFHNLGRKQNIKGLVMIKNIRGGGPHHQPTTKHQSGPNGMTLQII